MDPLVVRPGLEIPARELALSAVTSGGPGGQHVNKTSTKVQVRFDLAGSSAFTDEQKERLRARIPPRFLTADGAVVLAADASRSQLENKEAALARLAALLREGLKRPKRRVATKPTRGSRERNRASKERQSQKKRDRRAGGEA